MPQLSRYNLSRQTTNALIAIVAIAVVLLATFTFLWYNGSPISENKSVDVKITDFYFTEDWGIVGGLASVAQFNLTLKNYGSTDVNGLVLNVKMFDNGTDVGVGNYFFNDTYENGTTVAPLKAGELKVYSGVLEDSFPIVTSPPNTYYEASVILNNNILDKKTIDG